MTDVLTIQQNRNAWLEELRSGNRQQVVGYLACDTDSGSEVGFCCLGVATELAGLSAIFEEDDSHYYYGNVDPQYLTLPVEAQEWLGVNTGDPHLGFDVTNEAHWDYLLDVAGDDFVNEFRDNQSEYLTGALLNDQAVSFAQIADLIEHFGFAAGHDVLQGARPVTAEVAE